MAIYVTTTAVDFRHELLRQTYQSFAANLTGITLRDCPLIINVDCYGHGGMALVWSKGVAEAHFANVTLHVDNGSPSFPASLARVWSNLPADCDAVLHLEDDWELLEAVDVLPLLAMLRSVPQVALRAYNRGRWPCFVLAPSLIRPEICRAIAQRLITSANPEQQIRNMGAEFNRTVVYPAEPSRVVLRDLGRADLASRGYARNSRFERLFVGYRGGASSNGSMITANMATMPDRQASMIAAVKSLSPQVDRINIWGNGYMAAPAEVAAVGNVRFIAAGRVDLGAAGKFAFMRESIRRGDEYYLTVDDDFIYPPGYVQYMIDGSRRHDGAATTLHGNSFDRPVDYLARRRANCMQTVTADEPCDMGGTGVMCLPLALLGEVAFRCGNATDIEVCAALHATGIDCMVLAHGDRYLQYMRPGGNNIYGRATRPNVELINRWVDEALHGRGIDGDIPAAFKPLPPAIGLAAARMLDLHSELDGLRATGEALPCEHS